MSTIKAALLGTLLPIALVAPALAQQGPGRDAPQMVFETIDANGDGAITLEELQAHRSSPFAQADADGDGMLTRDELIAARQGRIAARVDQMIERFDANDDGQVSEAEIAEMQNNRRGPNPERMFDRIDADRDGQITQAEFDDAAGRMMDRRGHGNRHGRRDRG